MIANHHHVADEASIVPPVQHIAGWLHAELARCATPQVECDLMRRAWAGQGASPADKSVDAAIQMAAEDQFDLRVTTDDFRKRFTSFQPDSIHVADAGQERRMMHPQ